MAVSNQPLANSGKRSTDAETMVNPKTNRGRLFCTTKPSLKRSGSSVQAYRGLRDNAKHLRRGMLISKPTSPNRKED